MSCVIGAMSNIDDRSLSDLFVETHPDALVQRPCFQLEDGNLKTRILCLE